MREYHVQLNGVRPDLGTLGSALLAEDPAAVAHYDDAAGRLRLSTGMDAVTLLGLLASVGLRIRPDQVRLEPSTGSGRYSG
jgi:hypothetical protein